MTDLFLAVFMGPPTDWLRLFLVYLHLLCCVFALSLVLGADWQLLTGRMTATALKQTARGASVLLGLLWCTGVMLIIRDTGMEITVLAEMAKLQFKLIVVVALTINGIVLHAMAFPLAVQHRRLTWFESLVLSVTGAISTSHWLLAAFVGIARPMGDWPIRSLLSAYLLFLMAVVVSAMVLTLWVRRHLGQLHSDVSAKSTATDPQGGPPTDRRGVVRETGCEGRAVLDLFRVETARHDALSRSG